MNYFVKVDVNVDIRIPEQIEALNNFLTVVGQNVYMASPDTFSQTEETEKPKATRQRAKKVEATETEAKEEIPTEEIEVVAPEVISPKPKESEEEDLNDEPTIKIEDIRKLVAEKQAVHKDLLRAKLKEYGSANVTALPVQHYQAFYDLLVSLK